MPELSIDRGLTASEGSLTTASSGQDFDRGFTATAANATTATGAIEITSTVAAIEALEQETATCLFCRLADYLSLLDVWNTALTQLGVGNITATNDTVSQAVIMTANWDLFKAKFLADHAWNGAKKTGVFSRFTNELDGGTDVTPPGERWAYAYEIPSDYIRALRLNGNEAGGKPKHFTGYGLWEEEIVENDNGTRKRCIVTDEAEANVEYIFLVLDNEITLLSPLTRYAMALTFAEFLAGKFGKSPNEKQQLAALAAESRRDARRADSTIGTRMVPKNTSLLDARR